jgi:inner membrane protein
MENLAHSLLGVTLARTSLGRRVPFATPVLLVAANIPDADVVVAFWGNLYYLVHHRGITHSILGVFSLSLALAAIVWLIGRWRAPAKYSFSGILGVVMLTAFTHPLLDYTNSYGIRPFLPFLDNWYYGDLVFIVDPYLWLLLGGGVLLTARRRLFGRIVWALAILALSAIVGLYALLEADMPWLPVLWVIGLLILGFMKWKKPVWGPSLASGVLGVLVVYWTVLSFAHYQALSAARSEVAHSHWQQENLAVTPRPATPLQWDLLFQDEQNIYYGMVDLPKRSASVLQVFARNLDDPAVQAALNTCPGAVISHFGRFKFFEVRADTEGPVVIARDARYARDRDSGFGVLSIPLTSDLRRERLQLPCPTGWLRKPELPAHTKADFK